MPIGVFNKNTSTPLEDQRWRVGKFGQNTDDITLDLTTFQGDKQNTYLANEPADTDTTGWIRDGIPLVKIPESGKYGPYDPDATDGRNGKIEGFLFSQVQVQFGLNGWVGVDEAVSIMYTGVINTSYLPVSIDGAQVGGFFLKDNEDGSFSFLTTVPSATGDGPLVPADGSVTNAMLAGGITADKLAKGVIPTVPAAPTWANIDGKPAAAEAIANVTAAPTADQFNAVLAALRGFGVIAAK